MAKTKMPPIEKIHEAYSAIADARVSLEENSATVISSDHSKTYTVQWSNGVYSSNDSATYWQRYPGYPIIAVMMLQGKLSLDENIADTFKGINWKKLNKEHRSNYADAVSVIMGEFQQKGIDCNKIQNEIEKVYEQLRQLNISTKRSALQPPG